MLRTLRKVVLWTSVTTVFLVVFATVAVWRELAGDLPQLDQLADYRPPVATRIYAADGSQIGEFYVERRYLVPVEQIPERVRNAFIAAEDAEFYQHSGINPTSMMRALVANIERSTIVQGASTITQQVVKQLLLTPERTLERKVKEIILALQIERVLSKEQILYLYLNHIYFGAGTYGIAAAAQNLFGTEIADLSLAQAALLAGLPQAPSRYDPTRNPEAAIERQRYVLERMHAVGFITAGERAEALRHPLSLAQAKIQTYAEAPWYVEQVQRLLEEHFGPEFAGLGLQVHTAVDLRIQKEADAALRDGLRRVERRLGRGVLQHLRADQIDAYLVRQRAGKSPGGPQRAVVTRVATDQLEIRTPWETAVVPSEGLGAGPDRISASRFRRGDLISVDPLGPDTDGVIRYALDADPLIEGALVAMEPETGLVKALVGGVDFARSQFNRAVLARRQPGSAFKPLVYAAAVDRGYTAGTIVADAPISLPDGRRGQWTPKNFGNRYMGQVPLRTALARSLNTVSVRLAVDLGLDKLRESLQRFGFSTSFPRNYSLALGSAEVTPFELTRAYGVFATLGRRFEPVFITKITDTEGIPVDFPGSQPRFETVMNAATAYIMTVMMESVVTSGTAQEARRLGRPAAGKTGTTNDSKDAWFVGFTPELLSTVWVGFDSNRALGSYTGGKAALPIWTAFMQRALDGRPKKEFTKPDSVNLVMIDTATGLKAVRGRPSRLEAFAAGTEPDRFAPNPVTPTPSEDPS